MTFFFSHWKMAQAFKNIKLPVGGRGAFGGFGALLGLGGMAYGINASLYNGT
jgi:hypothetical protein